MLLKIIKINLKIPKKPIFSTTEAKSALISVFTSTCTSGNHTCKGQMGYLIENMINSKVQMNTFKVKLSK